MIKKSHVLMSSAIVVASCAMQVAYCETLNNTATRPVLTSAESQPFTVEHYLSLGGQDHWVPQAVTKSDTPYVVGKSASAPYHTVQAAINAALKANQTPSSITIKILPGEYTGLAYIPMGAPPVTIYGAGKSARDVVLSLGIDSMITPQQYRTLVNSQHQYLSGDPAWYMYHQCASQNAKVITTVCSAVVWSQSDQFAMTNLTIENSLMDKVGPDTHQGVALRTDGDKVHLDNVRLIGRQDTFFVNNADRDNQYNTKRHTRAYIKNSVIEGDVDYVFGRAQAVFDHVTFHTVSSREANSAYVFAPDTLPASHYGFLVTNSKLTCDNGFQHPPKLGRAWDQGARKTGYIPGNTSNGQLVIKHSTIQNCYDLNAPWGAAATTNRPFHGNAAKVRDINDLNYNRLWLYADKIVKNGYTHD